MDDLYKKIQQRKQRKNINEEFDEAESYSYNNQDMEENHSFSEKRKG